MATEGKDFAEIKASLAKIQLQLDEQSQDGQRISSIEGQLSVATRVASIALTVFLSCFGGLFWHLNSVRSELAANIERANDKRTDADKMLHARLDALQDKMLDGVALAKTETSREIERLQVSTDKIKLVITTDDAEDSVGFPKKLLKVLGLARNNAKPEKADPVPQKEDPT